MRFRPPLWSPRFPLASGNDGSVARQSIAPNDQELLSYTCMYGISAAIPLRLPLTECRAWLRHHLATWREALEQHRQVSVPVLLALSFLAGVGGAAQGNIVAGALVLSGIVGLVLAVWLGRRPWWFIGGLCLLASACGAARWLHHTPPPSPADLAFHVEAAQAVRGIVTAAPIQRQRSQQVTIGATEVETERGPQPVEGRVTVWARPYPALQVGDTVTLVGTPQRPAAALPAGYAAYLERNGVQAVMSFPRVYVRRAEISDGWPARMSRLRLHLRRVIDTHLPEPHAALAAGILLGQRADIPRGLNEQMHLTGTSHIIAISGANLTIIAGLLSLVIRRSGRALARACRAAGSYTGTAADLASNRHRAARPERHLGPTPGSSAGGPRSCARRS